MAKHIAFLKAINVGEHKIKMDHVKKLFEKMDFENVETVIVSRNVVFETKTKNSVFIKKKIEIELEKSLGYKVATFIRTTNEIEEIFEFKPVLKSDLDNDQNSLYVGFFDRQPGKDSQKKLQSFWYSSKSFRKSIGNGDNNPKFNNNKKDCI